MENFFSQFEIYIAIATVLVAGGVALYGLWDKSARDRRKQVDDEEDRLIEILSTTVKELEKKVDQQDKDIKALTKKVDDLESENNTLIRVLQGRDEDTKKFYEQAFETMKISRETHAIVVEIAHTKKDTNENMKKLIELMSKYIDVIGTQVKK